MNLDESDATPRVEIAVAVVQRAGRFLIGLRPADVVLGGYWEFPGGKIAPGETPQEAAIRECLEETGVEVRITGSYASVAHDYPHARVQLHFLACEPVEQHAALPPRFRWVSRTELGEYQFPPANAALLELIASQAAG